MVLTVIAAALTIAAAFLAAAIPPPTSEATALAHQIPHYMHSLQDRNSQLGKLNVKYHIQERLTSLVTGGGGSLVGGVLGAGALVLSTASALVAIMVLSIYFLFGLPQIKVFAYRLVPHSRRPRAILIGDEILAKVGGFVLGNFITSVIAGLGTYLWLLAFGVPYPLLLGMFVALLDLIPVIGSTIGGAVVTLVALTVLLPVALATLAFYIGYRSGTVLHASECRARSAVCRGATYCWSGDDSVDRLFQRTGLGRRPGRFLPGLPELGPEFLQLFAAEAGPHFGEPVLLFLFDVMRDVLDQHRGLGIEALSLARHAG